MTLADDLSFALPLLRAEAEARMVDACTITHFASGPGFDPETGDYTEGTGTVIYMGRCEVQITDGLTSQETEAAGSEIGVSRVTVKIPVSTVAPKRGDVVTITTATNDPTLVGQQFTVIGGHAKTYATARRLQVERTEA